MTPTARSLKLLREQGHHAEVVEKWNAHTKQRKDLFGFGDILAIKNDGEPGVVIVQTTSSGNMAARIDKIKAEPLAQAWLRSSPHNRIEVHGWGKYKVKRGGKAVRWRCRVVEIGCDDLGATETAA